MKRVSIVRDRMVAGMLAGAAGAVGLNGWSAVSYHILHFVQIRNLDLMAILVMGHRARGLGDVAAGLIYDMVFASAAGVVFALALPLVGGEYLLLKGWFWGTVVSLMAFGATTLFRVPHLLLIPYQTILSHFVDASLWGLITAQVLKWLRAPGTANGEPGPTG